MWGHDMWRLLDVHSVHGSSGGRTPWCILCSEADAFQLSPFSHVLSFRGIDNGGNNGLYGQGVRQAARCCCGRWILAMYDACTSQLCPCSCSKCRRVTHSLSVMMARKCSTSLKTFVHSAFSLLFISVVAILPVQLHHTCLQAWGGLFYRLLCCSCGSHAPRVASSVYLQNGSLSRSW